MRHAMPLLALAACGCPHREPAPPPRPLPVVASIVELAGLSAGLGAAAAADDGEAGACVALRVVEAAAAAAAPVIREGRVAVPALSLDASGCGELAPVGAGYADGVALIAPRAFEAAATVADTYGQRMTCRERAVVGMVLGWLGSAAGPIAHALQSGVPVVELPGVSADLTGCDL